MEADPATSKIFKEKIDAFVARASTELKSEKEELLEAKNKFKAVMRFYQFVPKGATIDTAEPYDFFNLWLGFCRDFKVQFTILEIYEKTNCNELHFTGYLEKRTAANTKGTDRGNSQKTREETRSRESEVEPARIESTITKVNE